MTRVIIDAALRNKLNNLTEPLELCDESGQVVARVVPAVDLSQFELWEPAISEEELQRREQSEKWYSTAEVLRHLQSLDGP